MRLRKLMIALFCLISFGTIAFGFYIVGSPAHNRGLNADAMREQDVSSLKYKIANAYQNQCKLPSDFKSIKIETYEHLNFPLESYKYEPLEGTKFKICANYYEASTADGSYYDNLKHGKGRFCHELSVDEWQTEECKKRKN